MVDVERNYDKTTEGEYEEESTRDRFLRQAEKRRDEEYEMERPVVGKVRVKEAIPRDEIEKIEPLKRVSPEIIGNLFDRIRFLKERIDEIQDALGERKSLHKAIISEIDNEIEDKESIMAGLSDVDQKRDFKLDISMLRKEKRRELVQFWKDTFEMRSELRELMEEYQTERKIGNLFKDMGGKQDAQE